MDLYVSWPAVSQIDSFIRFWTGGSCSLSGGLGSPDGADCSRTSFGDVEEEGPVGKRELEDGG